MMNPRGFFGGSGLALAPPTRRASIFDNEPDGAAFNAATSAAFFATSGGYGMDAEYRRNSPVEISVEISAEMEALRHEGMSDARRAA